MNWEQPITIFVLFRRSPAGNRPPELLFPVHLPGSAVLPMYTDSVRCGQPVQQIRLCGIEKSITRNLLVKSNRLEVIKTTLIIVVVTHGINNTLSCQTRTVMMLTMIIANNYDDDDNDDDRRCRHLHLLLHHHRYHHIGTSCTPIKLLSRTTLPSNFKTNITLNFRFSSHFVIPIHVEISVECYIFHSR